MAYEGELAGIATALLWAFGSLMFAAAGRRVGSSAVNEIRLLIALPLILVAHWIVFGVVWPQGLATHRTTYLALSGFVGLAIGDLFYFHCLMILGPRIGALLMATAPALTVVLAWIFTKQRLAAMQLGGIIVTSLGIMLVLGDRRGRREWTSEANSAKRRLAVITGLLAAVGQASGNVLSELGAVGSGPEIPALSSITIRMSAGTAGIVAISILSGNVRKSAAALRDVKAMQLILMAVAIGPTLGVWLFQVSIQRTNASIAAILVALVPIFMIPIGRVAYGSRPSVLALIGTVIAFAGTFLVLDPWGID